jgi:small subunit ribosomal protein S20
MANHRSAEKAHRQSVKKNKLNTARRSKIKAAVKEVKAAVATGDTKKANEALRNAQKQLARGAGKGLIKKNSASRLTKRLNASVKKTVKK